MTSACNMISFGDNCLCPHYCGLLAISCKLELFEIPGRYLMICSLHIPDRLYSIWCMARRNNRLGMLPSFIDSVLAPLQRRYNGRDGVSNQQQYFCLLNRLFGRRSKKTSKLRVTGLCVGNSPVTGEFHAQMARNAENVPFDDVIMITLGLCWYKY